MASAGSGDDSGSNAAQEEELDLEMQSVTIDVQKCAHQINYNSRQRTPANLIRC